MTTISWDPDQKNVYTITDRNTKKIWPHHFYNICQILRTIDIKYMTPQNFFEMTIPLTYKPYQEIKGDQEPGHEFEFDVVFRDSLFSAVFKYWQMFYCGSESPYTPPTLFGNLWFALATRKVSPIKKFDTSFRTCFRQLIKLTNETESPNLYEIGLEYTAITGTFSAILRDLVLVTEKEKYSLIHERDSALLEFFLEMSQSSKFSWIAFFRTVENAQRYEYLLKHLVWYLSFVDSTTCKTYLETLTEQQKMPVISWNQLQSSATSSLLQSVLRLWQRYQEIGDDIKKLPTTQNLFKDIMRHPKIFKPVPCQFTMLILPDPLSKNENRITFFAQFYGIHPRFWHPCSKTDLGSMTPHALLLDMKVCEFQQGQGFIFPVSDMTTCKLIKTDRMKGIIDYLIENKCPLLIKDENLATLPWFKHEHKLFEQFKILPSFQISSQFQLT